MDLPFYPEDFPNVCRLCLVKRDLKPFVDSGLLTLVSDLTNIEINECDRLPQNICCNCTEYLHDILRFIGKCKANNDILKSCLKTLEETPIVKAKQEEVDSDDEVLAKYLFRTYQDQDQDINSCEDSCYSNDNTENVKEEIYNQNHDEEPDSLFTENGNETDSGEKAEKPLRRRGRRKRVIKEVHNTRIPKKRGPKPKPRHEKNESRIPACDSCGGTFTSKAKLCQHYKENENCRPNNYRLFKCEVCGKEFSTIRRRNEHMNFHTGETPYVCTYCGKGFQMYPAYFKHTYRHRLALGEVELKPGYTEKRVRLNLQCQLCPKVFASRSGFANHMLIHQGIKVKYKKREKKEGDLTLKNFLCNYCAKSFRTKVQLDGHIRGHTGERPFNCRMCPKFYKTKAALKIHEQVHLGTVPKRFVCEICNKPFSLKAHFEVHRRTHTGEKPFECNFCGKCFNYRGTWRIHLRLHTGETPYTCPVCGNRYHDKSSLNKHQKKKNHLGEAVVAEKLILD